MAVLDGVGRPVVLAPGVVLTAPGLRGEAQLRPAPTGGRGGEPGETLALSEALDRAGMVESHSIEIRAQEAGPPAGPELRSRDGRAGLSLEVPYLGPARGQVLLLADEQGVLSWHFPEPPSVVGTSRGAATIRFVIPREVALAPPAGGAERAPSDRSLFTLIGKKILSVLVYPIATTLIGKGARFLAERWESEHRPHVLRPFGVADYGLPASRPLEADAWGRLADGRALLFVHGTFSTAHGSFAGLPTETMSELSAAYDGRVVAFDHPSLSVDPITNVKTLLDLLPAGLRLDVDVVGHSRGGLVARHLATASTAGPASIEVGRVVVVGTPNAGTPLADPKHMGQLVDRFTSLLNLIPPGPWSAVLDVLDAVIEVVKIIGQGALEGLPGLAAMNPQGSYLKRLEGDSATEVYAIDADFEPTGSLAALWRLPESAVDRVFDRHANDAVVPSEGVWKAVASGLTVPEERCVHVPADAGVWHCSYFGRPEVSRALLSWLPG
jgi:pimeloyl-ACP methyl ester carboxylesterase